MIQNNIVLGAGYAPKSHARGMNMVYSQNFYVVEGFYFGDGGRDMGRLSRVDWVTSQLPFGEAKHKKELKKFVNIM